MKLGRAACLLALAHAAAPLAAADVEGVPGERAPGPAAAGQAPAPPGGEPAAGELPADEGTGEEPPRGTRAPVRAGKDAGAALPAAAAPTPAVEGSTEGAAPAPPGHVRYHEEEAFVLNAAHGRKDAVTRAREASRALASALEARDPQAPEAPDAEVAVTGGSATVRVRGYVVTALYAEDALAAGYPDLETYAAALETTLSGFVPAQLRRGSLQRTVLHLFLSVFLALLAVVALRQLRAAFDRAEDALTERKTNVPALTVLRMPVLGPEAVAGLLAFLLDVGRVAAYVLTVVATGAAVFGQFDRTRPLLNRAVRGVVTSVVEGAATIAQTLPGITLALLLALGAHGGLRVLRVLLEGVRQGRMTWGGLPAERVPLFRSAASVAVVLLVGPLVVAAAFGRFGTPLETLALGVAGTLLLGATPLAASWLVGTVVLWRGALHAGDWVQVGACRGEITRLDTAEMVLVPREGGTLHVPMLVLLWTPVQRLSTLEERITLVLRREGAAGPLLDSVKKALAGLHVEQRVELVALGPGRATVDVVVRGPDARGRQDVLLAVADAVGRGDLPPLAETAGRDA